jgi:hypothetical protein
VDRALRALLDALQVRYPNGVPRALCQHTPRTVGDTLRVCFVTEKVDPEVRQVLEAAAEKGLKLSPKDYAIHVAEQDGPGTLPGEPEIVVLFGSEAERGTWGHYQGRRALHTGDARDALTPEGKRKLWQDLKMVLDALTQ